MYIACSRTEYKADNTLTATVIQKFANMCWAWFAVTGKMKQ